jgi:tetratricopeptide (TPR) repeat protein
MIRIRVELYRLLARPLFARYGHRQAAAMVELAARREQAEQLTAAVTTLTEAALVLRRVARSRPAYRVDLAQVLRQVCSLLFRLGRHDEEIAVREQVIVVYEGLVAADDAGLPIAPAPATLPGRRGGPHPDGPPEASRREELAALLHAQAIAYSHASRRKDAIAAWSRTIEVRRTLTAEVDSWPSADEQWGCLAAALRWRSADLAALSRYDEALADVVSARLIYRRLAAVDPAKLVHVAYCLGMTARQQARSGRPVQADETITALREFAFETRRPDVHRVCAEEFDLIARDDPAQQPDEWRRITEVSYPDLVGQPDIHVHARSRPDEPVEPARSGSEATSPAAR